MPLDLFNTLTRRKEHFEPLVAGKVGLYVCGPTVYDYAHIGNARPVVVFDVLYRLLKHLYPEVRYVRNITDVDDKIIDRAKPERRADRQRDRPHDGSVSPGHGGAERAAARYRATGDPSYRPDGQHDREADRAGQRLRGGRPCPVQRPVHARLRQAFPPLARRADRRRAGRSGALQARSGGLRAVEALGTTISPAGPAPGDAAGPAGISNARPWPPSIWGRPSTFMAAGWT